MRKKRRVTICLPLYNQLLSDFDTCVEAEIVDVAPHLSRTFAVHLCPWTSAREAWKVSPVETGLVVPGWEQNADKASAIMNAAIYLSGKTEAGLQKAMRKNCLNHPMICI